MSYRNLAGPDRAADGQQMAGVRRRADIANRRWTSRRPAVGMLGRQSVIGQRLKAGARRSRAVEGAFAAALLACLARPTRVGSSRWLCSTTFLARGADRNLAIELTLVGLPSELSSSAVRIPRSGASREEFSAVDAAEAEVFDLGLLAGFRGR